MTFHDKLTIWTYNLGAKTNDLLTRIGHWFSKTFLHPGERMKTFYLLFIVGICCYIYTWITNYCTVPLGGDYYLQEMTFLFNGYDDWHYFFETGEFPFWDRSVFLGIDNIGGNSFYYLFDPFFLILLPFPRDWLLTLQGLMFVPKMVIAGMFFYWYLGSFNLSYKNRRIGALAYGFSGWAFQYLWFHFIDSAAFLPLLLLGIEKILKDEDSRVFLVGCLLNAMTSYFFFVVFLIGTFFYALVRFAATSKTRTGSDNWGVMGCGIISFIVGIMLGCFTLLPGMYTAMNMPRTSSNSWLSGITEAGSLAEMISAFFTFQTTNAQNQVTPLFNFLFMPTGCYYGNQLSVNYYDNFTASLYATTPMLLMFFVGVIQAFKQRKWGTLLTMVGVCFLLFTPLGFYLFSGFTVGYARWFLLPTAWMIVFDCVTLENRRNIPRRDIDLAMVIVMVLDVVSCFLIVYYVNEYPSKFTSGNWDLRMIEIVICIVWVFVCWLVMRHFFHKSGFSKSMYVLCSIDIVVMANIVILFQGTTNLDTMAGGPDNISEESYIVELLKESENDEDFYRIYNTTADRGDINISLREGYDGLGSFHSVYAFEAQDFINRSRIPYSSGNWSMGIHNRRENLETFLGTKYYMVPKVDLDYDANEVPFDDYDIPYGYVNLLDLTEEQKEEVGADYSDELLEFLASDECDKSVYVNLNFIDLGFSFDTVMDTAWLATSIDSEDGSYNYNRYEDINEYPLLRFAMLDHDDFTQFYDEGKYNAGTYTTNGVERTMDTTKDVLSQSSSFYSSVITTNYIEGQSAPIELWSGSSKLQITLYSSNWPATESTPSGEYAYCDADNAYDKSCRSDWKETNPFEYANGIWPGDTKFDFDTLTDDEGNTSDDYSTTVLYGSTMVITPMKNGQATTVCTGADPDDPSSGCYISVNNNNNIEWRFFDEDNKLISVARHSYSSYKQAHGYYVDRPVAKIVGVLKEGTKDSPITLKRPSLYVQRNSDYQAAIDELKEYAIDITSRTENTVRFTTDYDEDRFVVLNYPRHDGWSLYRITYDEEGEEVKEEVTQYKAQGGFIGFEAEAGDNEYLLEYESPYFKLGGYITLLGLFASLLFFIPLNQRARKKKCVYMSTSFTYVRDEEIRKFKYYYDDMEDRK